MAAVRGVLARPLRSRPSVTALAVAAACSAWTVVALRAAADEAAGWPAIAVGPAAAALLAAFVWRGSLPQPLKLAAVWTSLVSGAIVSAAAIAASPAVGAAPLILAVAGAVAGRWPVLCYAAAFGLAGAWTSIELYTGLPVSYVVDFFLAGLWTSLVWGWITRRERPSHLMAAGTGLVGLYLVYALVGVVVAEPIMRGVFGFRVCFWYIGALILVPLVLQGGNRRELALKLVLLISSLIAAYAMLRWVIGPGGREEEAARLVGEGYSTSLEGELRLFGALDRPQVLGVWCAVVAPFGLVAALSPMGVRWRALGALLVVMCGLALVASDTRIAMAGVAAGLVAVLVLFGLARGMTGQRGPAVIVGVLLVVLGVGAVTTSRLNADDSTKARFEGLLNPSEDLSFQTRLVKWRTILDEVEGRPFGMGVGASGEAQQRYGRYLSSVSAVPDSTYVKKIYDVGIVGLGLFVLALLAVLVTLVNRVVRSPDPTTARLAAGGAGALLAFCVAMSAAEYAEGLQALAPWFLVGLGLVPGDAD